MGDKKATNMIHAELGTGTPLRLGLLSVTGILFPLGPLPGSCGTQHI